MSGAPSPADVDAAIRARTADRGIRLDADDETAPA